MTAVSVPRKCREKSRQRWFKLLFVRRWAVRHLWKKEFRFIYSVAPGWERLFRKSLPFRESAGKQLWSSAGFDARLRLPDAKHLWSVEIHLRFQVAHHSYAVMCISRGTMRLESGAEVGFADPPGSAPGGWSCAIRSRLPDTGKGWFENFSRSEKAWRNCRAKHFFFKKSAITPTPGLQNTLWSIMLINREGKLRFLSPSNHIFIIILYFLQI